MVIGQRSPDAPQPPEDWPQDLRDDVDLALMDAVNTLHAKLGGIIDVWGDRGVPVPWDKSPAREWILARIAERLFPRWTSLRWRRMNEPTEERAAGT